MLNVMKLEPETLKLCRRFELDTAADPAGRVTLYKEPEPGHVYTLGLDTAMGIEGRDFDAICLLDASTTPVEQVAEAHGHWGIDTVDRLVYAFHRMYNRAFCVIEANNGGLTVARRLWSAYACRHIYRRRKEDSAHRKIMDSLGYHRSADHATLWALKQALKDGKIIVRSQALIDQMTRYEWHSTKDEEGSPKVADRELKLRLRPGGTTEGKSPDLIRALEYAWHGVCERPRNLDVSADEDRYLEPWIAEEKALLRKEARRAAAATTRMHRR